MTAGRAGVKRGRANYVADFETSTLAWGEEDTRVWLWGLAPVDDADLFEWGTDIESFLERIQRYNTTTYFHNLKFDGWFIMDYLLRNGYTYNDDRAMYPKTFKALISDSAKVFSITVKWENGHTTEFRDSLKKLPMSVSRIAKSWELEEGKGELDYDLARPIGYQPTEEELDYLRRDVQIVCHALKEALDNGMTKLTVASDSLAEYKRIVGDKWFSRNFPILSEAMDGEIRRALRGGFTYADTRFSKRILTGGGTVYDVNSLYPFVMYTRTLPYGEPEWVPGQVNPTLSRPLTVFSVTFTARIKLDHIPCIQIKGHSIFGGTEYLTEIAEPVTLMVTNIDWELYNEQYDIEVWSWGGGWRFHAAEGMFDSYIDKWMFVKATSEGGKREIAKLHLNSLFGKFGTNPNVTSKIPYLEDDKVVLHRGEDDTRSPIYTAVAVFITSYARAITIRAAQENYGTFAYADTDSLHLLTKETPGNLDVHPSNLGAWKREYYFEEAFYARAKFYLEKTAEIQCKEEHDHVDSCYYVNRAAGLPTRLSKLLTFDDMWEGNVIRGKLNPKSVTGGVFLTDVPWVVRFDANKKTNTKKNSIAA